MKNQRTSRVHPNSVLIWQWESGSGQGPWTEESDNRALGIAGFERHDEEADLWSKDGVLFGRNAALQNSGRTPLASE